MKTLRLIYPQWQGGIISHFVPECTPEEATLGYSLGATLLDVLAPKPSGQVAAVVPVSMRLEKERPVKHGVSDFDAIAEQTRAALTILESEAPDRVVTLGGECSVSVSAFTYLAKKYGEKTAVLWIDAHPDLNRPGDDYTGYHAMALAACLGEAGDEIGSWLPATIDKSRAFIAGLREWDPQGGTSARQKALGIPHASPEALRKTNAPVLEWLESVGAEKVVVHLDLDVLDPKEIISAVGVVEGGMRIDEIVRLLRDVAESCDIVGLTVAEHMPRTAIQLRRMLAQLPLVAD